jgi:hypothetical protein
MIIMFTPFPKLSARYGAPMGRCDTRNQEFELDADLCARAAYEYDSGGAYWGLPYKGSGPVWGVWQRGKGQDGVMYIRAASKGAAFKIAKGEEETN